MFLSWVGAHIAHGKIEARLHLPIGVLGQTDGTGLGYSFQSRRDIDAVTHQVAVALLDHVAQMDADAELDAALRWKTGVALDHAVLHLDGAAHRVHHAAELDDASVAGALNYAAVMHGDGRIDQVASECPEPRQSAILVGASEPAVSDHIRRQYRHEFPGLVHGFALSPRLAQRRVQNGDGIYWDCREMFGRKLVTPRLSAASAAAVSGSLAKFTAMRQASSRVSSLTAERRCNSSSK